MSVISYGECCAYARRDPGLYLGTRTLRNRGGGFVDIDQFEIGALTAAFWQDALRRLKVANT